MLSGWDKEIPPSAEEAENRFEDILERDYYPRLEPLNDLLAWRKAQKGGHDQRTATIATQEIEAFMLTYNTHMAHPFEWKKGVRFYKRLKNKIAARSEHQLAA